MSKIFEKLEEEHIRFIREQKIFFVGTAAQDGRVNVSPKGMDTLRVKGQNEIIWLNLTGSGNETAAHIQKVNRMTIMFCAFEGKPLILRVYGKVKMYHETDGDFSGYASQFPQTAGARQVFVLDIDMVQTSCGFAVPLMEYQEDRPILKDWAIKKGREGLRDYWQEKNQKSIDGFETNIIGSN